MSHLSEAFKAITIKLSPDELADLGKTLGAASSVTRPIDAGRSAVGRSRRA